MSEDKPTTLELALEALIQIEHNKLPDTAQLEALEQTVLAWLEDERDRSPFALQLFREAAALKKKSSQNSEALTYALRVQKEIDSGRNKTDAIENVSQNKSAGGYVHSSRKITDKLKYNTKTPEQLQKLAKSLEIVKQALKKNR